MKSIYTDLLPPSIKRQLSNEGKLLLARQFSNEDKIFRKYGKTQFLQEQLEKLARKYQLHHSMDADNNNNKNISLPSIQMFGTVKMHGCNCAVSTNNGKIVGVQSRNRNLNKNQDMLGFYEFVNERKDFFKYIDYILRKTFQIKKKDILRFTGEWVGPGVQSRVGLSDIKDRLWILFDISIYERDESNNTNNDIIEDEPSKHLQMAHDIIRKMQLPSKNIYIVTNFLSFKLTVDLNDIQTAVDKAMRLTDAVAQNCPVSAQLGIKGFGEGIVWVTDETILPSGETYRLLAKTKSQLFYNLTKQKLTKEEKELKLKLKQQRNPAAFADKVVTDARIEQAFEYLRENMIDILNSKRAVPTFLEWIVNDVHDEEKHMLQEWGLLNSKKQLGSVNREIRKMAKQKYLKMIQKEEVLKFYRS